MIAYINRGSFYSRENQDDKALSDHNKAIEIKPKLAFGYATRGYLYYKKGYLKKTISNCNKALEIGPKNIIAYRYRGKVYQEKACADWRKDCELGDCYWLNQMGDKGICKWDLSQK